MAIKIYYDEPPKEGEFICVYITEGDIQTVRSTTYKYENGNLYIMSIREHLRGSAFRIAWLDCLAITTGEKVIGYMQYEQD